MTGVRTKAWKDGSKGLRVVNTMGLKVVKTTATMVASMGSKAVRTMGLKGESSVARPKATKSLAETNCSVGTFRPWTDGCSSTVSNWAVRRSPSRDVNWGETC